MLNFYVTLHTLIADRMDRNDKGATMVEYGLMVALIAVVVAVAAAALGGRISTLFGGILPGGAPAN